MSITSNMSMYSLTLQPPGMVTHAVVGNFFASKVDNKHKEQQVVLAQGDRLSLLQINKETEAVVTLLTTNCFGILRSLAITRVPGMPKGE